MQATREVHREGTAELSIVEDHHVGASIFSDFVAGVFDGHSTLLLYLTAGGTEKGK